MIARAYAMRSMANAVMLGGWQTRKKTERTATILGKGEEDV